MDPAEITQRFGYHPADTDEKRKRHEDARTMMAGAAVWVAENVPTGREQSLAITHLEEAMFWANAGIARHG